MSIQIPARPKAEVKAGPIGPGAGVLQTEFPLSLLSGGGANSPQRRMLRAFNYSITVPWIRRAESAIAEKFAAVPWHLEDENDEEITDESGDVAQLDALHIMEYPQSDPSLGSPYTRTELWSMISRTVGPCGSAFLLMDRLSPYGTPQILQPIAPWRFTAQEDAQGNLIGWWIDRTSTDPGIPLKTTEVIHFQLERAYKGHFGIGLVESALLKLENSQGLDSHLGLVISAGGRLSGILSPEAGIMDIEQYQTTERDWRTVVEQSDAAKRLQIVRAPVKFQPTSLTPRELLLGEMLDRARDDLLTLWGVPLRMAGGSAPAGLNSGETAKQDLAMLWQGPVHSRLTVFREGIQYQMLDRWKAMGATVELEIEEPSFDDDSPRFDLLGKSINTPMTNEERRALIGLDPFGDPMLDQAIWMPATIVPSGIAPAEPEASASAIVLGRAPQAQLGSGTPQSAAAGETSDATKEIAAKASRLNARIAPLHASLVRARSNIQQSVTPRLKSAVRDLLQEQKRDIVAKLREHSDEIGNRPRDTQLWFSKTAWDRRLHAALRPHLEVMASTVNAQIRDVLPPKTGKAAPPGTVDRVLNRGAAKVTGINETTRTKIQDAIIRSLDAGLTANDTADLIEGIGGDEIGLDLGSLFDDYRSEMIARTELMDAYNGAALYSYQDAGVQMVTALDGDQDEECAARDGQDFTVEEADGIEDHPNGTLDWVPIVDYSVFGGI